MKLFLSAGVPIRRPYQKDADPFLIQTAVRSLFLAAIQDFEIVWGGHPAITPMVWEICLALNSNYTDRVHLYQSEYFASEFPGENSQFPHVTVVAARSGKAQSLAALREVMLNPDQLYQAGVFIGGERGIVEEYAMFRERHPNARVAVMVSTGGGVREIWKERLVKTPGFYEGVDFATYFADVLGRAKRDQG